MSIYQLITFYPFELYLHLAVICGAVFLFERFVKETAASKELKKKA